jgi:glycosyltransferase involved in cell wall biosynthesis
LKLGILVVAYNAEKTITSVISRIPKNLHNDIHSILISDDYSTDATYEISKGLGRNSNLPITVFRQPKNLGYGGNQKFGYQWAIDNNLELVVLLHGDGQYAPEYLSNILNPLIQDEADAVFGSRMLTKGGARLGGMPLYKFAGNKTLTWIQNKLTKQSLSEWHSGYRAYKVEFLKKANIFSLSNGFRFDTQIILQMINLKARLTEVPIPTYYGEEISRVNGIIYGVEIIFDTIKFSFKK